MRKLNFKCKLLSEKFNEEESSWPRCLANLLPLMHQSGWCPLGWLWLGKDATSGDSWAIPGLLCRSRALARPSSEPDREKTEEEATWRTVSRERVYFCFVHFPSLKRIELEHKKKIEFEHTSELFFYYTLQEK